VRQSREDETPSVPGTGVGWALMDSGDGLVVVSPSPPLGGGEADPGVVLLSV